MEKCGTPAEQKVRLMPWKPQDMSEGSCEQKEEESPYFNVRVWSGVCVKGTGSFYTRAVISRSML